MAARKKTSKKKPAAKKKQGSSKLVIFFKYMLIFAVMLSVSAFLFFNRHTINDTLNKKVTVIKDKVAEVKQAKKKPQEGYKKEDRDKLNQLISGGSK